MLRQLVTCALALLCTYGVSAANQNTSIVLHAVSGSFVNCNETGGMDCETIAPTIDITGMANPAIFVLLRNYTNVRAFQCAFDVPATWAFTSGLWDCQVGQVSAIEPSPPFGPLEGTIATAFNEVTGGELEVIGRMHFASAGSGCIDIIESVFVCPPATSTVVIVNELIECESIDPANWGRVCVGSGGYNACEAAATPVEPATWTQIKRQYR